MQQTTTPLAQYLQPLLTYKKIIAAIVVLTVLLGTVIGFLAPTNYRASASILVSPIETLGEVNSDVDIATELSLAKSSSVLVQVSDRLKSESIDVRKTQRLSISANHLTHQIRQRK